MLPSVKRHISSRWWPRANLPTQEHQQNEYLQPQYRAKHERHHVVGIPVRPRAPQHRLRLCCMAPFLVAGGRVSTHIAMPIPGGVVERGRLNRFEFTGGDKMIGHDLADRVVAKDDWNWSCQGHHLDRRIEGDVTAATKPSILELAPKSAPRALSLLLFHERPTKGLCRRYPLATEVRRPPIPGEDQSTQSWRHRQA